MKKLTFELIKPELKQRYENNCIVRELKFSVGRILGVNRNLKATDKLELNLYMHI